MKTGFQRIKISRKGTANSSASKEKEQSVEEKTDKLKELKEKIEKDRLIMRKTGKRFNTLADNTPITHEVDRKQSIKKSQTHQKDSNANAFTKKEGRIVEVSVGEQDAVVINSLQDSKFTAVIKEKIDLKELVSDNKPSLESSRVFSRELAQQKNRNKQISNFLSELKLDQFSEGLINMGYDDLDVLVQITSEQLNFLMMRAYQQKILLNALNQYKKKHGIQDTNKQQGITNTSAFIKTKTNIHFKKHQQNNIQKQSGSYRPKTTVTQASIPSTNISSSRLENNSSLLSNPSFFYSIGANDWSMESLTRRACSSCFKVVSATELIKINQCFYCVNCKNKENDVTQISLTESMIRNYKL